MQGKLVAAIDKSSAIHKSPFPDDKTKLRSFLPACNLYRRFVHGFAKRARPINGMLKKGAQTDLETSTPEQQDSLEDLKNALVNTPILALPKRDLPFMIDTDVSKYDTGATLLQRQDPADENLCQTIGFWSKTLTETERKYSATERECLSVLWGIQTLRPYI